MSINSLDMKEVSAYVDILRFAKKTKTNISLDLVSKFSTLRNEQREKEVKYFCSEA